MHAAIITKEGLKTKILDVAQEYKAGIFKNPTSSFSGFKKIFEFSPENSVFIKKALKNCCFSPLFGTLKLKVFSPEFPISKLLILLHGEEF
jgi:hypothetical protein